MRAKLYILDCQNQYYEITLSTAANDQHTVFCTDFIPTNPIVREVHPIQLYYVLKELYQWNCLRQKVVHILHQLQRIVVLKAIPVSEGVLDIAWSRRAHAITWQKVEEENLMSWLSTLGGAFSALGDSYEKCVCIHFRLTSDQRPGK